LAIFFIITHNDHCSAAAVMRPDAAGRHDLNDEMDMVRHDNKIMILFATKEKSQGLKIAPDNLAIVSGFKTCPETRP